MGTLADKNVIIEKLAEVYYRGMPGSTQVLSPGQQAKPGYTTTQVSDAVARPTVAIRPQLQLPEPYYAGDYSKLNFQQRANLKGQDPDWEKKMNSWWSGRRERMAANRASQVAGTPAATPQASQADADAATRMRAAVALRKTPQTGQTPSPVAYSPKYLTRPPTLTPQNAMVSPIKPNPYI